MIYNYRAVVEGYINRLVEAGEPIDADDIAFATRNDLGLVIQVCKEKLEAGVIDEWTVQRMTKFTNKRGSVVFKEIEGMIYLVRDTDSDRTVAVKAERFGVTRLIDRLVEWCGAEDWNRFESFPMPLDEDDRDIVSRITGVDRDKIDFMQGPPGRRTCNV